MAELQFNDDEATKVEDNTSLKDPCEENGVPFGCEDGLCGTCIVEIEEGMENLTPYTEEEEDFLGEIDCERMACQCSIKSGKVKIRY
jgi:ferredoxin